MAHLTREAMEAVIRSGGSVKVGGRVRTRIEDLPTAADLARGDPQQETAVANNLQAQINDLQAQLTALRPPMEGQGQEQTPPADDAGQTSTPTETTESAAPAASSTKKR